MCTLYETVLVIPSDEVFAAIRKSLINNCQAAEDEVPQPTTAPAPQR